MILLLSLNAFAADNWDLLRTMQEKQAVLSQPILLGTTNAETKNAADFIQRIDPTLRIQSQALPVIGDLDAEINRALAQKKLSCALILRLENDDWSLTEYGDCTSPDPTLSLDEREDDWDVLRTDRAISAMEWAVLTKDTDLHDLLLEEQKKQLTLQRGLLIGSGLMAVSSIAPLQGIQPGGGSATEDRLWTSAFLISSAWMLYKASKYPAQKIADTQNDLSNYISKPYARTTINGLFSKTEAEEAPSLESQTTETPPKEKPEKTITTEDTPQESEESPSEAVDVNAESEETAPPDTEAPVDAPTESQTPSTEDSTDETSEDSTDAPSEDSP